MTAEPPRPTEAKASALERLLDYAFKNPFIAMWNLALIVGGFIALVYFTQIGYFPDLDLKSGSSFLIGIAFLGIFLSALLAIVFTVPSWMIRTEVWRNYLQLKERVPGMEPQAISIEMERKRRLPFIAFASLHGLAAACFWLFIFGCFGIKAGHEEFANRIQWCAAVGGAACCILLRVIFRGLNRKR
jgi:NADH:ubiquinone oxidoreductase subunit 6 (subunit J)